MKAVVFCGMLLICVGCTADRTGLASDAGNRDQTLEDVTLSDVIVPGDTDPTDMAFFDMNMLDMATPDMAVPDRGVPDKGVPDKGVPDMTRPDQNLPDINVPDLGIVCPPPIVTWNFRAPDPQVDKSLLPPNPVVQPASNGSSFNASGLTFDGTQTGTAKITNENQINDAIKASGSFSVRVQLRTANITQGGPRRILTNSENGSFRNFSIMQQNGQIWIRVRSTYTNENGTAQAGNISPADMITLKSGPLLNDTDLFEVMFVFDANTPNNHTATAYVNGVQVDQEVHGAGTLTNWENYQWGFGNEVNIDQRAWTGTVTETQIWTQALDDPQRVACGL